MFKCSCNVSAMSAVSAVLSPRYCHCATVKIYVSMSVSVQCLSSDVECVDVPEIWCLHISICICVLLCVSVPLQDPDACQMMTLTVLVLSVCKDK